MGGPARVSCWSGSVESERRCWSTGCGTTRLSRVDQARALAERALRALAGLARALKVKYQDIEVGFDFDPEPGLADNGDLEHALQALVEAVGRAAQRRLPVVLVGAVFPQLRGRTGRAKSHAERLFDFPEAGPLAEADARAAIEKPMREQGVTITPDALTQIVPVTRRYPYFLQEWGKHTWDTATDSPITIEDVQTASKSAIAALDESIFRVRLDLTG